MAVLASGSLLTALPSVFITLAITVVLWNPWSALFSGARCYLPFQSLSLNARARARRVQPGSGRGGRRPP